MKHKQVIHDYQRQNNLNQKIQCFDLSQNNDETKVLIDASCKDDKFDGMQIYFEDGIYEVSEMIYNSHINVFCETKSFKIALKYFFRGNKQKIKKVIQTN